MARPKKNPVTEMPITELEPVAGEPGIVETETQRSKNNVVPISTGSESIEPFRDWSDLDRVLSTVVNFI